MFQITEKWIDAYRTPNGGFSQRQLQILGIYDWPPMKGWKRKVSGNWINDSDRAIFESYGGEAPQIDDLFG